MSEKYRVDLHIHTSENSPCSPCDGYTIAEAYKNAGFQGIVVTNHFLQGSATSVPKDEWADKIDWFFTGYEHAKEYGDAHGLDVFFGWEFNFNGADWLTYGLDRLWLKGHPDMCSWSPKHYSEEVHKAGGFITHAHPFREAGPLGYRIQLFPRLVDGVEIYNGSHEASCYGPDRLLWNKYANQFADNFGLFKLTGSDTHGVRSSKGRSVPARPGSVYFNKPFSSVSEMIEIIKEGQYANDNPLLCHEEDGRPEYY